MAKVSIEESTLYAIGDAIREKGGTTAGLDPEGEMPAAIRAIQAGGGAEVDTFTFKIDNQCVSLGLGLTEYFLSVFQDGKIDTEFYNGSMVKQSEFVFENVICNTPIYVGWSGYTSAGIQCDTGLKELAASYVNGWVKYTGPAGAVSVLTIFDDD